MPSSTAQKYPGRFLEVIRTINSEIHTLQDTHLNGLILNFYFKIKRKWKKAQSLEDKYSLILQQTSREATTTTTTLKAEST